MWFQCLLIKGILKRKYAVFSLIIIINPLSVFADSLIDFNTLSLEALLAIKVDIASNKFSTVMEQPGTVTLLSEEQISRSGASNLMELLNQVAGFWQGTDTLGTLSVSFRGIWGMEAKILLIIDGIEQNELAFGTLVLGKRYPTSTIEQVEIIRGPGSVKYGGQAALAVIKVTTKGRHLDATLLSVELDFDSNGITNNGYSLVSGGSVPALADDLRYSFSASFGSGDYSNERWTGLDGYSFNLKGKSDSEPLNVNLALDNDRYQLRFIYDRFRQEDRLLFGDSGLFVSPFLQYSQNNILSFESYNFSFSYNWQAMDNLALESKFTYASQKPWNVDGQYNQNLKRDSTRWRGDFTALYDYSPEANVLLGLSFYREDEEITESYLFNADTRFNGDNSVENDDYAVYLQYEVKTDWFGLTLGGRYENHDFSGSQFVPRLALNKIEDKFHAKLAYNEAFKIPQFDTIASANNSGMPLKDNEKTKNIELELGYKISDNVMVSGNAYWMKITNYIAFDPVSISNTTLGDFSNFGIELIANWKKNDLDMLFSYSTFLIDETNIDAFTIQGQEDSVLGIPNHMLKLNMSYYLNFNASLNISGAYISPRYACITDNNFICGKPEKQSEEYDFKLFYRHQNIDFSYQIGIANVFDSQALYIQPYRGSQSPIPALGRRLMFNFTFQF